MILPRKRKTKDPCPACGLHRSLCICEFIPRLSLATKVSLIIHRKELKRTTNTGRLALQALVNSEMRVRGAEDRQALDLSDLIHPEYQNCLFFPAEDAIELSAEFVQNLRRPVHLIVPDGNWRQASKVNTRHPELQGLLRVKISLPNTAVHHLRVEHLPEGMSTLEAITSALEVLEGKSALAPLRQLYEKKLNNTLLGRGVKI